MSVTLAVCVAVTVGFGSTQQAPPGERPDPASARLDANRLEVGMLPAIAYDSDTGVGFGAIGSLAKFNPSRTPYAWRLEFLIYMTMLSGPSGRVELPYHDDSLGLDLPGLLAGRLRLRVDAAFARHTTTGYYGLGNAAPYDASRVTANGRYYQYDRIWPHLDLTARAGLWQSDAGRLELAVGSGLLYNWVSVYPGSKLEEDLAGGGGELRGIGRHGIVTAMLGILWDSRNHETAPDQGMFHEISVRGGMGEQRGLEHRGVNFTARFYTSVVGGYLGVAMRLMGDALFGLPPLYALARHGGVYPSSATGGATSLRGVAGQRLHGKAKLLGNLELRSQLVDFTLSGERFNLGALGFVDAGRVWAAYRAVPELDGRGAGVKTGVGGGLRLRWGETFVVRGDFAFSPTEGTMGTYIGVGHIF